MRRLISLAAFLTYSALANAQSASFLSFSMQGNGLYHLSSGSTSVHMASEPSDGGLWDFCKAYSCGGYAPGVTPRNSSSDPVLLSQGGWAHEQNVSNNGVVDLTMYTFPSPDVNMGVGKYVYDFSVNRQNLNLLPEQQTYNQQNLNLIPEGQSFGLVVQDHISLYATPGRTGSYNYSLAATFDPSALPAGVIGSSETEVLVSFYSSWVNAQGRPASFSQEVFHQTYSGSFATAFSLNPDLSSFPVDLAATYGSYSISVLNKMALAPVPEPETYAMLLAGLGLLGLTAKRRRQRLRA